MNGLSRLFKNLRGNPLENPATPLSAPAAWLFEAFGGGSPSASGVTVNETTAMQLATVYACINVLSSDVSSLPLKTYEQLERGKRPAEETDLYNLLAVEPNPDMTAPTFFACLQGCAALTGNGYAEIQRDVAGRPVALWPRNPSKTKALRQPNGDLYFELTDTASRREVATADMLHIPGLSLDGVVGLSPIMAAKQTIGTAIAAEKYGARFFGNGSRPSGLLTGPTGDDKKMAQAKESWEKANSGENQGRTAVMPQGWDWKSISISPEEAQFLQTQQFTRSQIAALFRLPPHMIGDTSRLSNSNHESQALEYVTFTLRPWLVRFETEIQRKLMPSVGRNAGRYSVRFDVSELIRGDFASQMTGFATGRQWGFYTANDVRTKLGENPLPDGDTTIIPLNMVVVGAEPEPTDEPTDVTPADTVTEDPKQLPSPADEANRTLVARMSTAYSGLFRDALGRVSAREKRDSDAIHKAFSPVLQVIADEAKRQAAVTFKLSPEADLGSGKIIRDHLKTLEKRASEWTAETLDTASATEVHRAVKAIVLGTYREAGTSLVLPKDPA